MPESEENPLVVIRSLVYNHEPYLRDCLEGFVMQQTSFPFVAVVHDDCSTDNSAAIIREYAEKYPHIIKPIYETENQYSKRDGSLRRAMDEACGQYGAKYYALCEGDDYWTDPHKLQKQVDFMESHPDYTMVCSDAVVRTPDKDLTEDDFLRMGWYRYHESRDMAVEDIIERGGLFIHTASIVYRDGVRDSYPEACLKCHVGDYPLQVMAALQGKVYYFHEKMVVYRLGCGNSFTAQEGRHVSPSKAKAWNTEVLAIEAMDAFSNYRYTGSFHRVATKFVLQRCHHYPYIRPEIMEQMGRALHYGYVAPHMTPDEVRRQSTLLHQAKRFLFRPYYPFNGSSFLLPLWMQFFYQAQGPRQTYKLGPLHLWSVVHTAQGNEHFCCGRRLFRTIVQDTGKGIDAAPAIW